MYSNWRKSKKSRAFLEFRPYSAFNFGGRNRRPKAENFPFWPKGRNSGIPLRHPEFQSLCHPCPLSFQCPSNVLHISSPCPLIFFPSPRNFLPMSSQWPLDVIPSFQYLFDVLLMSSHDITIEGKFLYHFLKFRNS